MSETSSSFFVNSVLNQSTSSNISTSNYENVPSSTRSTPSADNLREPPETIAENQSDEDGNDSNNTSLEECVLSVYWKRGSLGAAAYRGTDAELLVLNDLLDINPDFANLGTLINQIEPSQVLTCDGTPEVFLKRLNFILSPSLQDESVTTTTNSISNKLIIVPMSKTLTGCINLLLQQRFRFEPSNLSEENRASFIGNILNFELESMMISLGMLFRYLERHLLTRGQIDIVSIRHISLEKFLSMDESAYNSLQIFNSKQHPSAFKRVRSGCKEGLSIYSLFSRCRSVMGLQRMREIMRSPTRDTETIKARLDAIEFLIQPKAVHVFNNLVSHIKKVHSVSGVLSRLTKTRAQVIHWQKLYTSIYHTILIAEICRPYENCSKLFESVVKSNTENLALVALYINKVVDFKESLLKNKFSVEVGIDARLDEMRAKFAEIPQMLAKIAELELNDLPDHIEKCSTMFITELGYLLLVPAWLGDVDVKQYDLPNFQCKFIADSMVYYKTPRCNELDRTLGDIIVQTSQIESEIMVELIEFINQKAQSDIINAVKIVAELDCVLAMAEVAAQNNYTRPEIIEERCIEISGGRHPLQELCVDAFVPNDCYFGGENGLLKVLTGPNASGKSVYLKQIALIAYLAHIGSFVPASKAKIGLLENIHTRIQTVEAVSTKMSAFMIDLKQMRHCLYNSTPSTLLIIDEFGKGTTEVDGLALLYGCLKHFVDRQENCPLILASTHYHRLPSLLPQSPLINYEYMEYMIIVDKVTYLHKIKKGMSGTSLAALAVRTAGLSESAMIRAQKLHEGKEKLLPNPNLKITIKMYEDIFKMTMLFAMIEEQP